MLPALARSRPAGACVMAAAPATQRENGLPHRPMTPLFAAAGFCAAVLAASPSATAQEKLPTMTAEVMNLDGESLGTVVFTTTASGSTHLAIELEGLPSGSHGFHVHETGLCDSADGFKSAGGHYAAGKAHGILAADGPHPGDFPNIHVARDGILVLEFFTDALTVGSDGENPLDDEDGSAIVIHDGADDYESQPSGNAGERIGCGVIR